jgi:hypothetical protein
VGIIRSDAVGQLVQPGLAQHDSAGVGEPLDNGRVEVRNIVGEELRARSGTDAFRGDQIFVCDGNAVERAAIETGG